MSFADTPESVLHYDQQLIRAVLSAEVSKVRELLDMKVCQVNNSVYANGWSLLHGACYGGNVDLVRILIQDYKADVNVRDNQDNTPLHVAAQSGQEDVVLVLVRIFGCNSKAKGYVGRSILHDACCGDNVNLVRTLVRTDLVDIGMRDDHGDTPLHLAAFEGKQEVVAVLIEEFGCNVDVQGHVGRSALHSACEGGDVALVRTLICKYGADINLQDDTGNTPLLLAASVGNEEVTVALVKEFNCNLDATGQAGWSLLHSACYSGNVSLVRILIRDFLADTTARDDQNNTPLHLAALEGKEGVVVALIKEFGCSANVGGHMGRTVLHSACEGGNINLVRTLICDCGADLTARDYQNSTPLHVAAAFGEEEVVVMLIKEFGYSTEIKGHNGKTVLHGACYSGNVSEAKTLIQDLGADTNARDDQCNTPLHLAAKKCSSKTFEALVCECGISIEVRGYFGRSVLHSACATGNSEVVELLSEHISLLAVDDGGNTPLHTCSAKGYADSVKVLLKYNAPVLVRNKSGKSPRDVAASDDMKALLNDYIRNNQDKIYLSYDVLQDCAKRRYANADPITRMFVIGNPGAGKSSLIATLKIEGFFESFWRVTEDSVPPHTAGIIPSVYRSRKCGRVLFYDFAGDPEYYSSHAAILENLTSSKLGNNVFIIVINLLTDCFRVKDVLGYWISFIRHQKFSNEKRPSLAIMGSHLDQISSEMVEGCKSELHAFCMSIQPGLFLKARYFMLDCCQPKSQQIAEIQSYISAVIGNSPHYDLSLQASVLLGLLEKDFSNVTACSIEKILSHIKTTGVLLPDDLPTLLPVLRGLHDIGLLFVVGDCADTSIQIVLKIPQLTKEVHQLLFSKKAKIKFSKLKQMAAPLSLGILPQDLLDQILPDHITKECLAYLQYCQEISYRDIKVFTSDYMPPDTAPTQSLFFFPALCALRRSDVSWVTPPNLGYSIGWLARSSDPSEYFPSRFLHVLLLRLVFRFTLSVPKSTQISNASPVLNLASSDRYIHRRCTMWKTGVRWLMEEGVECMVELTSLQSGKQGVAVITRCYSEVVDSCLKIFNNIISCVMEAKAEFCPSMKPDFFLLDSTEAAGYLNDDNLFAMSDVERVLTSIEGKEAVVSITGKKMMKREEIVCLRKVTHWNNFFPLDFRIVLCQLQEIVSAGEICRLGLNLDLPTSAFQSINSLTDIDEMKMELVRCWLHSSRDPPCWWQLVQALKMIDYNVLAAEIERKYSAPIQLQQCLLNPENSALKPDEHFLVSFAGVIGDKWPSLASTLSLTSAVEEVKKKRGTLSYQDRALMMLNKWASRDDASYGQLCRQLKTIVLFQAEC